MTEDAETATQQRDRSPAFPVVSLETAFQRLTEFETHFKRSAARPEKIGDAWKIKTKAYVDRIAAALRYFGLLEYQGAGKDRNVVVSEEGRKFLRAQQEETKREVIKAAALRPKQIAKFWGEWGSDRPADAACLDELVLKNSFSEAGSRDFLKVYDATISYAGLSESDKVVDAKVVDDGGDTPPPIIGIGDLVQVEINGAHQLDQPKRVRAIQDHEGQKWVFIEGSETGVPMEQAVVQPKTGNVKPAIQPPMLPLDPVDDLQPKGARKEITSLDEGTATLTWPDGLSQASVEDLELWLNGVLRKARRSAGLPVVNYTPGTLQLRSLIGGAGLPPKDEEAAS